MDLKGFKNSLSQATPPAGLSLALQALWYEARGDWHKAHHLAQEEGSVSGAWVHAYLHRKEGDTGNAAYWYSRAGRPSSELLFDEEWEEIARALLAL